MLRLGQINHSPVKTFSMKTKVVYLLLHVLLTARESKGESSKNCEKGIDISAAGERLKRFTKETWKGAFFPKSSDIKYKKKFSNFKSKTEEDKLFTDVPQSILNHPSFLGVKALFNQKQVLDNVKKEINEAKIKNDYFTYERQKINFLSNMYHSAAIQDLEDLATIEHIYDQSRDDFDAAFELLWLEKLPSGNQNTSILENYFIGSLNKKGKIVFQNWINLYLREQSNEIKVTGITVLDKKDNFVKIDVLMEGKTTPVYTYIGTMPEAEVALLTLCFTLNSMEDACKLKSASGKYIYITYSSICMNENIYPVDIQFSPEV